jgi:hypothetical protein
MRKVLISLLLAGAAASPAVAGPHSHQQQQSSDDRQSAREERQQAREERQSARQESRNDRSNDRAQSNQQVQNAPQVQQQSFNGGGGERNYARPDRGRYQGNGASNYVVNAPNYQDRQQVREQRIEDRNARQAQFRNVRELRQSNRATPNVMHTRNPLVISNTPRPGTQPPLRADNYRRGGNVHWDTNWRHNGRYDWHNYRHHHRSLFHLGFYYDPYGWGYQPFSIGWRLWPNYYSSNYWINDPWMYRLPYAPPGYVWVRYWNDALLVDRWSGTVVDVIPGFFW